MHKVTEGKKLFICIASVFVTLVMTTFVLGGMIISAVIYGQDKSNNDAKITFIVFSSSFGTLILGVVTASLVALIIFAVVVIKWIKGG